MHHNRAHQPAAAVKHHITSWSQYLRQKRNKPKQWPWTAERHYEKPYNSTRQLTRPISYNTN
eukprot:12284256-Prorocentrum_lima.AAC.1